MQSVNFAKGHIFQSTSKNWKSNDSYTKQKIVGPVEDRGDWP